MQQNKARSRSVKRMLKRLSISYQLETVNEFVLHLRNIATSSLLAADLASSLPVRMVEKFDEYLPDHALNIANGHDRLQLDEAKFVAEREIADFTQIC